MSQSETNTVAIEMYELIINGLGIDPSSVDDKTKSRCIDLLDAADRGVLIELAKMYQVNCAKWATDCAILKAKISSGG